MALLECKNLSLGYGSTVIQKNLNFSINSGDYVFITGENGSGKSTLMKTILGFTKPLEGNIEYSKKWNKKSIGYLPQTSELQKTFPATVMEIVISGFHGQLGILPFYKKSHYQRANENLKKLGMLEYSKKSFKELSGGQQQRVLFARALCAATSILVLDEPSKGFDSQISNRMYEIISELNKEGLTVISISHDLKAAEQFGTKIIRLEKGEY